MIMSLDQGPTVVGTTRYQCHPPRRGPGPPVGPFTGRSSGSAGSSSTDCASACPSRAAAAVDDEPGVWVSPVVPESAWPAIVHRRSRLPLDTVSDVAPQPAFRATRVVRNEFVDDQAVDEFGDAIGHPEMQIADGVRIDLGG
jgi:hypothetical protein